MVAHMGEEDPLRGWAGSGTIFFSRCNMHCQFCQNYDISQTDAGQLTQPHEIAAMMLELQAAGCHNINLVSPSHVVPQIMAAVLIAARSRVAPSPGLQHRRLRFFANSCACWMA